MADPKKTATPTEKSSDAAANPNAAPRAPGDPAPPKPSPTEGETPAKRE